MDLVDSHESSGSAGVFDLSDVRAQADEIYAHILASVDVCLAGESESQPPSGEFNETSHSVSHNAGVTCGAEAKTRSRCRCGEPTETFAAAAVNDHNAQEQPYGCSSSFDSCCAKHAPQQMSRGTFSAFDAARDGRTAAAKEMFSSSSARRARAYAAVHDRAKPCTFGSGRKGMSGPVRKVSAPGPGSYFRETYSPPVERRGRRSSQQMEKAKRRAQSAMDKAKKRQEEFAMLCECYWKQFLELEMPSNAAAHATHCPCQNIRAASPHSENSSDSRSNSRDTIDSIPKQQGGGVRSARCARSNGRGKMQKGAVFGTSPRRTLFVELADEDRQKVSVTTSKGIPLKKELKKKSSSRDRDLASPRGKLSHVAPGPGAYNVPSAFDTAYHKKGHRGVSITRAPRELHTITEAPGPGSYAVDTTKVVGSGGGPKKNYFLSSSPRQLELVSSAEKAGKSGPGPGEYRIEGASCTSARHKSPPAFSFGRAKLPEVDSGLVNADTRQRDGPGPGTYDLSGPTNDGGGRATVMTTARRDDNMWRGALFDKDDVPGPGTYKLPEDKKGPAYSLRARPVERREPSPGPGQYELPDGGKGPQWSFIARRPSTSFPLVPDRSGMPGPGEYFVPLFDLRREHSPAPVFGTAPRKLSEEIEATAVLPGPGAYDLQSVSAGVSPVRTTVMGTSSRQTDFRNATMNESTPGPGTYVVQYATQERRAAVPILTPGAARFDTAGSIMNVAELPGPGNYDIDAQVAVANRRGAVVGSAPRFSLFDASSVTHAGPGTYDIPIPKQGPSFSMRHRPTEPVGEPTPGPGLYSTTDTIVNQGGPNIVLGSANRFPMSMEERAKRDVPGPGSYIIPGGVDDNAGPAAVFGTDARQLNSTQAENVHVVGPGSYDPRLVRGSIHGAAWGMEPRFTSVENRSDDAPGPGTYEVNGAIYSQAHGAVIGTAGDRSTMDWTISPDAASMPGPGSYFTQSHQERQTNVVFGSAPQHTLSPAEREAYMNTNLGPGSYEARLPYSHTFHASFGTSVRPDEKPNTEIGPGHYDPANPGAAPPKSLLFGTAPRLSPETGNKDVPGPGSYEPLVVTCDEASAVTFPTAQRFPNTDASGIALRQDETTPGPGSYEVNGQLTQKGGAVVFGTASREAHQVERDAAIIPGPGHYQTSSKVTGTTTSAYAFGKEARMPEEVTYRNVPGPGAYDTTAMNMAMGGTSPAYSFPTSQREVHPQNNAEGLPGPGQYNTSTKDAWQGPGAVSFGTGSRFQGTGVAGNSGIDEVHRSPGPGQYAPSHPEWNAGPVYSFPIGSRKGPGESVVEVNLPGPTTYNPKPILLNSSPSPVFGTESRHFLEAQGDVNLPGPGYYNLPRQTDGPNIRFGTAERGITEVAKNNGDGIPGPGSYDVNPPAPGGPAYTIYGTAERGPTHLEVERAQLPGPGAYSVPPSFPSQDTVSFMKAVRFQLPGEQDAATQPGPGYYNSQPLETRAGPTMGRAPRLAEIPEEREQPGPGHYDPGSTSHCISPDGGATIRFTAPRFSGKENGEEIPGPASYNLGSLRSATAGPSFPQAPRLAEPHGNSDAFPGPGEYSIPPPWESIKGASSFGTGRRVSPGEGTENLPGPGTYDSSGFMQRFMSGPAFSLQGKPVYTEATIDNPGPGTYNPRPVNAAPAFSFGALPTVDAAAAFDSRANAVPGPAAYNLPSSLSSRAAAIGTAARDAAAPPEGGAGPGAYQTSGPVVLPSHSCGSFGYAPRPDAVPPGAGELPGPGAYHHPIGYSQQAHAFTFAGAERFADGSSYGALGPGEYFRQEGGLSGPAFSFPIAPRLPQVKIAETGGGH